ncbi:coiled-coil domain-containing protein [Nonomuraea sp. NPDC048826]|uniref:coiled-coil domain-containing protein n=1 Tax=Nonomuraea sp. NPDC048826 TaxID=3364347 RepID=UPI00371D9FC7
MAAASPAHHAIGFITAAAVAFIPVLTAPAAADPKPSEQQLRKELKQLNAKVDKLIERYNLKRVELAEARKAAQAAEERLATAEKALDTAEQRVADLARLQYQNGGGMRLPSLMTLPDGRGAALLEQLTAEQQAMVAKVAAARDEKKKAVDEAAKLAKEIEADAAEVTDQREDAEDVIKDIQGKLEDLVPFATGRRSDGSWAPQLPSGSDNITPRTRLMKTELAKNFALPFSVGCFRAGSSGEHPLGRACDFMMSTGGSMPTAGNAALGDRIAEWALSNRAKLGVKYVIWKQRINHGSGWSGMSNRGSITENHFDHVHISMH